MWNLQQRQQLKPKCTFIFALLLISLKISLTNEVSLKNNILLKAANEFAILNKDANITNLQIVGLSNIYNLDADLVDVCEFMIDKSSSKPISNVFLR